MEHSKIHYSVGSDDRDNNPTQLTAEDFDEFEAAILSARSSRKGLGYFCGPLSFGSHDRPLDYPSSGHYRLASHALPRSFLCLDHDGYKDAVTFDEVMVFMQRFRGFAYTTWSSTDDNPRARLVLELSRTVNRDEGITLGAQVDGMIRQIFGEDVTKFDPSVHRAEQPCFAPGLDSRLFHFSGRPINVDAMLQQSISRDAKSDPLNFFRHSSAFTGHSKLSQESLEMVLSRIDPTSEPMWFDVACALARAYGSNARQTFKSFSKGDYWPTPYTEYDEAEVDRKFDRALNEASVRPRGYGVRRLIQMAGLSATELTFSEGREIECGTDATDRLSVLPKSPISLPFKNARGQPLPIVDNVRAVIDAAGVTVRYNQITKRQELIIPGLRCVSDEYLNSGYTTITDKAIVAGLPSSRIRELVDVIASENPYCPVRTFILSVPWDGRSRFETFLNQIKTGTQEMSRTLWRKWLIQAVAAAFSDDGISNAGVLVLSGNQGVGKTRLFRAMTADIPTVFAEGITLNPAEKDSVLNVISHWIVELGEIEATFRKADMAQLKAFITRSVDVIRRPFAQKESKLPRRTVFAGTVNDLHCLHDPTGNRRFWPLLVDKVELDPALNYQQLWAEVHSWYVSGETWHLTSEERKRLELHNELFVVADPDVEALLGVYRFHDCQTWVKRTMREICAAVGLERATKSQQMRLAEAIRRHNGGQMPHRSNGRNFHFVPDLSNKTIDAPGHNSKQG